MEDYAWLIDLIHRRKNCPAGMISGWVQKVTEHRGTTQWLEKKTFWLIVCVTIVCPVFFYVIQELFLRTCGWTRRSMCASPSANSTTTRSSTAAGRPAWPAHAARPVRGAVATKAPHRPASGRPARRTSTTASPWRPTPLSRLPATRTRTIQTRTLSVIVRSDPAHRLQRLTRSTTTYLRPWSPADQFTH